MLETFIPKNRARQALTEGLDINFVPICAERDKPLQIRAKNGRISLREPFQDVRVRVMELVFITVRNDSQLRIHLVQKFC